MKTARSNRRRWMTGFTLAEMTVSMGIATAATAGCLVLFVSFLRSYNTTTLMQSGSSRNSMGLDRMVYGVGTNSGLREAFANSLQYTTNAAGWRITYSNAASFYFMYTNTTKNIVNESGKVICSNVVASSISTNGLTKGCQISVTVADAAGGKAWTNTMGTIVQFRN